MSHLRAADHTCIKRLHEEVLPHISLPRTSANCLWLADKPQNSDIRHQEPIVIKPGWVVRQQTQMENYTAELAQSAMAMSIALSNARQYVKTLVHS